MQKHGLPPGTSDEALNRVVARLSEFPIHLHQGSSSPSAAAARTPTHVAWGDESAPSANGGTAPAPPATAEALSSSLHSLQRAPPPVGAAHTAAPTGGRQRSRTNAFRTSVPGSSGNGAARQGQHTDVHDAPSGGRPAAASSAVKLKPQTVGTVAELKEAASKAHARSRKLEAALERRDEEVAVLKVARCKRKLDPDLKAPLFFFQNFQPPQ